jgi:hypothetical protein
VFTGSDIVNSNISILTGGQNVLLPGIDFHIVERGLSLSIVTSSELWHTAWTLKEKNKKKMRKTGDEEKVEKLDSSRLDDD